MPLSAPVAREPIHQRTIVCRGYRRVDGLWEVEGHVCDTKSYPDEDGDHGPVPPGQPIHDMWIRLTLDDDFRIRAVETAMDAGPFGGCSRVVPNFQRLVGLTVGAGWTRAVKERLGGVKGCTHLGELLGPLATSAFQTMYPFLKRQRPEIMYGRTGRPVLLDSCHMLAAGGEAARKEWPDYAPSGPAPGPPSQSY